jgi:glycine/D-amino acid oxidase-like deaminating enzyme
MTLATVPNYARTAVSPCGEHAVVVGAGMAGLLAARVLTDGFDEVTVVERDALPDEAVARRGVPQARHVHVLLEAGRATLEDLFPGYRRAFLAAGGLEIDGARDVMFYATTRRRLSTVSSSPARVDASTRSTRISSSTPPGGRVGLRPG